MSPPPNFTKKRDRRHSGPPHLRQKGHGTQPAAGRLAGADAGAVGHDVGLQLLLAQPAEKTREVPGE